MIKKVLIWVGLILVGVMFSEQIKGMLTNVPLVGSMFNSNAKKDESSETE